MHGRTCYARYSTVNAASLVCRPVELVDRLEAASRLDGAPDVTHPVPSHLLIALRPKLEGACGDDELRRALVGHTSRKNRTG
jgi:hypothetical protein